MEGFSRKEAFDIYTADELADIAWLSYYLLVAGYPIITATPIDSFAVFLAPAVSALSQTASIVNNDDSFHAASLYVVVGMTVSLMGLLQHVCVDFRFVEKLNCKCAHRLGLFCPYPYPLGLGLLGQLGITGAGRKKELKQSSDLLLSVLWMDRQCSAHATICPFFLIVSNSNLLFCLWS